MRIIIVNEEVVWREYSVEVDDEFIVPEEIVGRAITLFLDGQATDEGVRDVPEERIIAVESEEGELLDCPEVSITEINTKKRNLIDKLEDFFKKKCKELGYQNHSQEVFLKFLKEEILKRLEQEV